MLIMDQENKSDKKSTFRFLIFLLGCLGMYLWINSGIDHCGSVNNAKCIFSDAFDFLVFGGLLLIIFSSLFGLVNVLLVLIGIIGLIIYSIYFK